MKKSNLTSFDPTLYQISDNESNLPMYHILWIFVADMDRKILLYIDLPKFLLKREQEKTKVHNGPRDILFSEN